MVKVFRRSSIPATLAVLFCACTVLHADPARFDLTGPKIDVHVTRAGKTLPIAEVPNLQPGDKIWLHADLPPTQSIHYLLVAAFLRGTTNPPPDSWFTEIQTWNKKVRAEGVTITVPGEAQQVLLFLAPETGGDFSTLRSAVRGRPGVFVRASQDLIESGFEQARIETYLTAIRRVPPDDPAALAKHSDLLSRTLSLKPNGDCFKRPVDTQSTCLTQAGNQSLLDDGHGETVADALNGPNSDFINQASYTSLAGAGNYSAYVGAVVDLIRITSALHTAKYQYIPAIAFPDGDALNLRLNTPPSFQNPKSVIVIGLPAIQAAVPPPLRPSDIKQINCLLKPKVVLSIEGAPLVYATSFAHDLVLHLNGPGPGVDIPVTPDAYQGGLVLAPASARKALPLSSNLDSTLPPDPKSASQPVLKSPGSASSKLTAYHPNTITGIITGYWGFDPFQGPAIELQNTPGKDWKLATDDVLIAGRENTLTLTSTGTACIQDVTLEAADTGSGKSIQTKWKAAGKPDTVNVAVSLKALDPGSLHLAIQQYGQSQPDTVAAQTFSEPARLISLELHAGDTTADLTGTSLDQVKQLTINHLIFTPASANTPANPGAPAPAPPPAPPPASEAGQSNTHLRLTLPSDASAPKFHPGDQLTARFLLNDGRALFLPVTVAPPRPSVTLIGKNIGQAANSPIHLAGQDDLPLDQQFAFSLKSAAPFPRTAQIEIASADDSLHTMLNVAAGNLVLQNAHTLLATLNPLKAFGTSAFGPLRLRPVSPDGTTGDWIPLATLVRLPTLTGLRCPSDTALPCTIEGTGLYLVDSISTDAAFTDPTTVPEGFVGDSLTLPHPPKTGFFLRLRDDPTAVNIVTMPIALQSAAAPPSTANATARSTPKPDR